MNIEMGSSSQANGLLLRCKKHYRVSSPKIAAGFFESFMGCGKGDRGYRIRFVEIPEKCAIELQARSEYDLLILEKALKAAKIIKHEIPFEINPVVKMLYGRRDKNKYEL